MAASSSDDNSATPLPPLPKISSRTLTTLDPCVILMKQIISQHAPKWKDDPHGIYSLAQGVVHWRPPQSAYDALSKAVQDNFVDATVDQEGNSYDGRLIHTYCPDEGLLSLRVALKEKLEKENGLNNSHVMVTSGANQAFVNCVLTLLDECDEDGNISKCVVFEPYYFNHVMAVQSSRGGRHCGGTAASESASFVGGADGVEGLLVGPTNHGVPDLAWLRSQLEQYKYKNTQLPGNAIRMVTLVNPGNPTGVSLPHSFLKEITALTKEFGVWLVMDNTYEHFDIEKKNSIGKDENDANTSTNERLPDFPCLDEEHVINIFSFSKGYAMAGFRVGYIALSSKMSEINGGVGVGTVAYEQMLKVQDTIAICTSRISQMAALGALRAGRSWVYEQVKTLEVGRRVILEAIDPLDEIIGGNGAMYVMGKLPEGICDQVRLNHG